jgi:uncharacterized protein (TIGR00297 family)
VTSPLALPVALALTAAIVLIAWRAGSLARSGALAALAVGTLCLVTSPAWGSYLVGWFAATSLLSRAGRARKARHVAGVVAKGGARDAWQVLANGGVYAIAALGLWLVPAASPWTARLAAAGAAALAAAGADTWATEIGTWARATAWSLRTGARVPAGTSGAITATGTLGLLLGATSWAAVAAALGVVPMHAWPAVAAGGVAGAMADTLAGAWWQVRRHCDACDAPTEQPEHACGATTRVTGGWARLDNDAVNLLATVVGAAVGFVLASR